MPALIYRDQWMEVVENSENIEVYYHESETGEGYSEGLDAIREERHTSPQYVDLVGECIEIENAGPVAEYELHLNKDVDPARLEALLEEGRTCEVVEDSLKALVFEKLYQINSERTPEILRETLRQKKEDYPVHITVEGRIHKSDLPPEIRDTLEV